MSIRNEISERFATLSSEKEIKAFLNEIITALHDINNAAVSSLVKDGAMSEERANNKGSQTDTLLKQIVDNIYENIKIDNLHKKAKAYDALKTERDTLASKVERAKDMLAEKDAEIEKTKKATKNELKKKLQIGRDKVVAIAETSTALSTHISSSEAIDILNNIRDNVGLLTEEMVSLGLWDEDDVKPNIEPIVIKVAEPVSEPTDTAVEEKPKKKTTRKTTKKVVEEPKVDEITDSQDVVSLDDDLTEKKDKKTVTEEESQISLSDIAEENKQEE